MPADPTPDAMEAKYTAPCVDCGRPTYVGFQRCGECANTPPNLTAVGLRRLRLAAREGAR